MRHPPYHLRPNKAVDRLMLMETIRKLDRWTDLSEYTYYGFGGPYLEEFRLLYEFCPEIRMVSIEEDAQVLERQRFHLPCGTLELQGGRFRSFLAQYTANDVKAIFWLDNTGFDLGAIEDFQVLLEKVAANSVVKVSLRAEPRDYMDKAGEFRQRFATFMPDSSADPPSTFEKYAGLLQDMLQVAAEQTLPAAVGMTFQPLTTFCYSDGTGMFSLTGVVCRREELSAVRSHFISWPFASLNWGRPKRIDVPFLSTKERLHLQEHLPCKGDAGRTLLDVLGYSIDEDRRKSAAKLKQYADFHRYFPYFMKAVP